MSDIAKRAGAKAEQLVQTWRAEGYILPHGEIESAVKRGVVSLLDDFAEDLARLERKHAKLQESRRFHAACAILQGRVANPVLAEALTTANLGAQKNMEFHVESAVVMADALLAALGGEGGG
jgi:hypothetical protein